MPPSITPTMNGGDNTGCDEDQTSASPYSPPAMASIISFPHSAPPHRRRLSRQFPRPTHPVLATPHLAWISLQGRLVGAEEATSSRAIGGGLGPREAVAWELFAPMHRVLIVAVVAVAASESRKNLEIWKLQKSVQLRDQVLSNMEQKLDDLCEQLNKRDQTENGNDPPFVAAEDNFCWLCQQHRNLSNGFGASSAGKAFSGDEEFKNRTLSSNVTEHEERRMSDLSDWASSSIASLTDIQTNALGLENGMLNLKRENEEKDAAIEKLSSFIRSSATADSKRIAELEDIIRRKNQIITKYKRDMIVLDQKVVHLSRLRRPSSACNSDAGKLPFMAENIIYDMESSGSPSSSDPDCPRETQPHKPTDRVQEIHQESASQAPVDHVKEIRLQSGLPCSGIGHESGSQAPTAKIKADSKGNKKWVVGDAAKSTRSSDRQAAPRSASPLQERLVNRRVENMGSWKPRQAWDRGVLKARKRGLTSKDRPTLQ